MREEHSHDLIKLVIVIVILFDDFIFILVINQTVIVGD